MEHASPLICGNEGIRTDSGICLVSRIQHLCFTYLPYTIGLLHHSSSIPSCGLYRIRTGLFFSSDSGVATPSSPIDHYTVPPVGLEPTNSEEKGFTVPSNCHYATTAYNLYHQRDSNPRTPKGTDLQSAVIAAIR